MLESSFSIYNLLSILTCFVGLLYAFQIGTLKKTKSIEHKYFTWYLIVVSFLVFLFFLVDINLKIKKIGLLLVFLIVPCVLLMAPLMWLYIRKLISKNEGKGTLIHFLPSIITAVLILIFGIAFLATSKPVFIQLLTFVCIGSLIFVFLGQNILYIYLSIRGFLRHRRKMQHIYSYSEEVDLSWVRGLIIGYVVFIVGMIVVNNISKKNTTQITSIEDHAGKMMIVTSSVNDFDTGDKIALDGFSDKNYNGEFKVEKIDSKSFFIPKLKYSKLEFKTAKVISPDKELSEISNILFNLIVLLYIIYTGHNAMKQKTIAVSEPIDNNEELIDVNGAGAEFDKDKTLSEAQLLVFKKIKEDLLELMKTEKPYLDHNLNIFTLSKRLNTNSKYLSQVINLEFNKSFVHFVNEYRIEEAKQILLANNNYTIEAQSQMVGFKSKSSFNMAFKRHTGVTPSLYIQGHGASNS